jgi:hypothetical protein
MEWAVARNEWIRAALRAGVIACGHLFALGQRRQIAGFAAAQERLRRRYGIGDHTPVLAWGPEIEASIARFAAAHADARFAFTSGSTSRPKKLAFTRTRLRRIKRGSFSVAARMYARYPECRAGLFILSSLKSDDSLTSLILDDEAGWLGGLIMPARHLRSKALQPILESYGVTATRLWLMVLADPGILYSTNPSTLAVFLRELEDAWPAATRLVREHASLPPEVQRVAAQLASPGWRERFERIAAATAPRPIAELLPGLAVYCTWDGGYVRPFLDQVRPRLGHARFIPMYSMSTETVETLTHYDGDVVRFLPLAPGVLYEFLPEGSEDLPAALVPARAVEPGRAYSMVVSDPYGLVRYQTDDLFECRGRVGDVPDLAFLRRRGLSYSFTGEKLTDRQVSEAFRALFADTPALDDAGVQLTCIPSLADAAALPGYRLVLAHTAARAPDAEPARVAAQFDAHLARINREFAAKLESGRLAPTRAVVMSYDALAARLDGKGDVARRSWDSQFKLLPLYRRTWESYGPP